jgi:hypothetical protein
MRPVLVTLFWCWFAFSVGVYAYRLYRRVTRGPRAAREARAAVGSPASAPTPVSTARSASAAAPVRATVADALAGIALPCDLAPLTGTDAVPDPYRLVCFTDRSTAGTVRAAIAGELERLGYSLRSVSSTETVATRDGTELTVTLHPTPEAFPTAPPGSVVAVFST